MLTCCFPATFLFLEYWLLLMCQGNARLIFIYLIFQVIVQVLSSVIVQHISLRLDFLWKFK